MSDRLQFFRKQIAAVEGAARPELAIEKGHYVEHPHHSLAQQLTEKLALRPTSSHLVIGGIGSGKTTELLIAKKKLADFEDIRPCYIDISKHIDLSHIKPGVLAALIGLFLVENFHIPSDDQHNIREFANGDKEERNIDSS
ncbi:MAG: hypothetical protein ACPGVO_14775 [Spirulinaceae cyanobacterium]